MSHLSDLFNRSSAENRSKQAKKPKRKRPSPISVRVTDAERAELERRSAGTSLSSFMKECALRKSAMPRRTRGKFPVKDHQALARVLRALGSAPLANRFHRIPLAIEEGRVVVDDDMRKELRGAIEDVAAMRADLVKALGLKPLPPPGSTDITRLEADDRS
ncbi:MAG: hypothetical protein AAGC79_05005 [Pseudomonadota bacterium]